VSEEPTINSLILDKLDATAESLNARLDATERALSQRLDRQDRDLDEIKKQTQRTNGRVTALERARERAQGVIFAYSWLPSTLSAVLGSGLTILVMALSGNLHG
jgi:chromosome segregation ATPase